MSCTNIVSVLEHFIHVGPSMLGGELERAFSKFIFKVDVGSVTDENFGAVGMATLHCPVEGSHSKHVFAVNFRS